MQRYLVIGRGKTGTTVISTTIDNTTGIHRYYLEPKRASFFEGLGQRSGDAVVKILFDHWESRPRVLSAIVGNEFGTNFRTILLIARDPRAEFISRIHYAAYGYFSQAARPSEDVERWLTIFRRKEAEPGKVTLRDIVGQLGASFGVLAEWQIRDLGHEAIRYADFLSRRPDNAVVLRYEDFATGNLADHPCRDILSGSRDVGSVSRTRRTAGADDWSAFVLDSDREWIDDVLGSAVEALGYDRHAWPERGPVLPKHSSGYLERIIDEAVWRRRWGIHPRLSNLAARVRLAVGRWRG